MMTAVSVAAAALASTWRCSKRTKSIYWNVMEEKQKRVQKRNVYLLLSDKKFHFMLLHLMPLLQRSCSTNTEKNICHFVPDQNTFSLSPKKSLFFIDQIVQIYLADSTLYVHYLSKEQSLLVLNKFDELLTNFPKPSVEVGRYSTNLSWRYASAILIWNKCWYWIYLTSPCQNKVNSLQVQSLVLSVLAELSKNSLRPPLTQPLGYCLKERIFFEASF